MNGPLCPRLARAEVPPFGTAELRHDPAELRLAYASEPPTLDPAQSADSASSDFVVSLFAGLVRLVGPELTVQPDLATHWEVSADGRTYRFVLRPTRWSDGTPVTAEDVAFSVRRTLEPATAAPNAQLLYPLAGAQAAHEGRAPLGDVGVRALDAKTVEFTLHSPAPWFLQLCAHAALRPVPAHRLRGGAPWPPPEQLVTSGPFTVAAWRFRRDVKLAGNPFYWQSATQRIRRVQLTFVARPDTAMALYEDGELDELAGPVPVAWLDRVAHTADFRPTPRLASDYYWLNTLRPPLDDVRVRRALHWAIDRAQLATAVVRQAVPAGSLVPPVLGGEPHRPSDFDPARARAELRAAGFPGGRGLRPLRLVFNAHEQHRRVAQAVQNMWHEQLGIEVQLRQAEWQVYLHEVHARDFDIARLGWVADYADARSFLHDVFGPDSQQNYSGWHDAAFAEALAQSDRELEPTRRAHLLKQAERRLLAALPLLPLLLGQTTELIKPYVRGHASNPLGTPAYQDLSLLAPRAHGP